MQANIKKLSMSQSHQSVLAASPVPAPPGPPAGGGSPSGPPSIYVLSSDRKSCPETVLSSSSSVFGNEGFSGSSCFFLHPIIYHWRIWKLIGFYKDIQENSTQNAISM